MRSFHLYRRDRARSRGFSHPETDPESVLALIDTIVEEDAHVLVGGEELPPISYGLDLHAASLVRSDGTREPLPTFSITGEDFTMVGLFSRPFWLGGGDPPGMFQLAQIPLMTLDEGETLVLERSIHVGERADVASVADQLLPGAVRVTGRVDDPTARLHFATANGAPEPGEAECRRQLLAAPARELEVWLTRIFLGVSWTSTPLTWEMTL